LLELHAARCEERRKGGREVVGLAVQPADQRDDEHERDAEEARGRRGAPAQQQPQAGGAHQREHRPHREELPRRELGQRDRRVLVQLAVAQQLELREARAPLPDQGGRRQRAGQGPTREREARTEEAPPLGQRQSAQEPRGAEGHRRLERVHGEQVTEDQQDRRKPRA
jgi:hypothetical protein